MFSVLQQVRSNFDVDVAAVAVAIKWEQSCCIFLEVCIYENDGNEMKAVYASKHLSSWKVLVSLIEIGKRTSSCENFIEQLNWKCKVHIILLVEQYFVFRNQNKYLIICLLES